MKVCIISGSSRKNNNTLRLAKAIFNNLKNDYDCNLINFEHYDLPFFNQKPIDINNLSEFQNTLIQSWTQADLIYILSPEYNWFPSAEMVNMLHQFGNSTFVSLFENKTFAFAGVSSGRGGRIPAIQLGYVIDKLINVLNTKSITVPKKFEVQFITQVLSEQGESLGQIEFDNGLKQFIESSLHFAKKWNN